MENTNEIIEATEEVVKNDGLAKAVKIGGTICAFACGAIVAYDYAIKPLVKTIKTKLKENKMVKESQLLDAGESEEHTEDH